MIRLLFFVLFIVYMGWNVMKLWKDGEKKELFLVLGIGVVASYLLLAKVMGMPIINLLQDFEGATYPIGLWLQKFMGIHFLE